MAYAITEACLKCGICIDRCPEGAIIAGDEVHSEGLILQPVTIDPKNTGARPRPLSRHKPWLIRDDEDPVIQKPSNLSPFHRSTEDTIWYEKTSHPI